MAAATTSHRPWENPSPTSAPISAPNATQQTPNKLPSITALTSGVPGAQGSGQSSPASTRERSSGAWSSQPQSTRSSAYSNYTNGYPMHHSGFSSHASPNRASNTSQLSTSSHPGDYSNPPSSAGIHASPGFATVTQSAVLPFLNQNHDPSRHTQDFPTESRRSSLGSQVNQGLNSLHLNGTGSPYPGSVNHSSTSLAQNLSRERGITNAGVARNSRSSGSQMPMSPMSPVPTESRINFTPRIAPPIGRNPRSDIYNANEPIQGQAYAFPDPPTVNPGDLPPTPGRRRPNSIDDPEVGIFSRRDSGHTSIASSIVTSDSHLPPGQRRLDDSSDVLGTHHHTLQQNQVASLNGDSELSTDGVTPYSRTPALRVSHKMAERKRRSEMKDLFENLRSQIPSNQGSKSSKWEILTKASDYIKTLEGSAQNGMQADKQLRLVCHELEVSRRDNDSLRNENQKLLQDMQRIQHTAVPIHQQSTSMYPNQQPPYNGQVSHMGPDPSRSLPPLTNGATTSSSMQGVQYTHERL